jgi:hypothetical protein
MISRVHITQGGKVRILGEAGVTKPTGSQGIKHIKEKEGIYFG